MTAAVHQFCGKCGAALGGDTLVCPACQQLVYAAEMEQIAAEAKAAETAGRLDEAIAAWTKVLGWLPAGTAQYRTVSNHLEALHRAKTASEEEEKRKASRWKKLAAE